MSLFKKMGAGASAMFGKVKSGFQSLGQKVGDVTSRVHDVIGNTINTIEKGKNYVDKYIPELAPISGLVGEGLGFAKTANQGLDVLSKIGKYVGSGKTTLPQAIQAGRVLVNPGGNKLGGVADALGVGSTSQEGTG